MDIVYFIYGLAFLVLGVVIVIWPKAGSRFAFARLSLWLAGFAFGARHAGMDGPVACRPR